MWLYDYQYKDKNRWDTRGDAGWACPVKLCDEAIHPDEVISEVEKQLKIGKDRDWSFYETKLEDYIS